MWLLCLLYVWFLMVFQFFPQQLQFFPSNWTKSPSHDQSAPPRAAWLAPSSGRQIGPQSLKPCPLHSSWVTHTACNSRRVRSKNELTFLTYLAGQPGPPHSAKQTRASKDHVQRIGKELEKFQDFKIQLEGVRIEDGIKCIRSYTPKTWE